MKYLQKPIFIIVAGFLGFPFLLLGFAIGFAKISIKAGIFWAYVFIKEGIAK